MILAEQDNILSNPKTVATAATAHLLAESGVENRSYRSFQTHEKPTWHTAKTTKLSSLKSTILLVQHYSLRIIKLYQQHYILPPT